MKKILVIIDVQNDFVTGSLGNEEAKKKVPNIVKKIREFNGDAIIATRDTHGTEYLSTKEGEKLPVKHCIEYTVGWHIEPTVQSALFDASRLKGLPVYYIDKPTFGSVELAEKIYYIAGDNEFEIEFVGFCTDICVVSNVLLTKANYYEKANITVDANCCAGVTIDSHNAALTTMKMCQVNVIEETE